MFKNKLFWIRLLEYFTIPTAYTKFLYIYTTSQKFLNSKIFNVFLKNSLLLTKPAFIWSKIQQKQ